MGKGGSWSDEDGTEGFGDFLAEVRKRQVERLMLVRILCSWFSSGGLEGTFAPSTNASRRASICECSDGPTIVSGVCRATPWHASASKSLFMTAHHIGRVLERASGILFPLLVESTTIHLAIFSHCFLLDSQPLGASHTLHDQARRPAAVDLASSY